MELKEKDLQVIYQSEAYTLAFRGRLRISDLSPSYKSIEQFCARVVEEGPEELVLNLSQLQDMDATGMNLLMRLVKRIHEVKKSRLRVYLSPQKYRQGRLQTFLHKMFPEISLEIA